MRFLKKYDNFLNEISSQMKDNVINTMKERGQDKRAKKWTKHYISKELAGFENAPIMGGKFIIYGFDLEETKNGKKLTINYGSPREQQNNKETGSIGYYINDDKYTINYEIDKKTARTLSKIAQKLNPNTKYKQTSVFKIKGR